ncbi:unnamed protein product [Trichogramma brassicae]|uniref:Uncharacterized protein n=1 Tax=Trichogramma brassicae TaxID=86971 RepID=A0A6H5I548_9HYME|nr:unnamed protein product [Trichogramma brassicae]
MQELINSNFNVTEEFEGRCSQCENRKLQKKLEVRRRLDSAKEDSRCDSVRKCVLRSLERGCTLTRVNAVTTHRAFAVTKHTQ